MTTSPLEPAPNVYQFFSEEERAAGKVTMSNRLARATHQLSLQELRAVYLALTKAKSFPGRGSALALHRDQGWRVKLNALEYAKAFGLTRKAAYVQLGGMVNTLMEKRVRNVLSRNELGQESFEEFVWVTFAHYDEAEHTIEIVFNAAIAPHLLGLKDHFTLFLLRHISGLDSGYAVALYRNLKSWTDVGRWAPKLEDFWEVMEIPEDSYYRRDFKGLRMRVIEPAVASINGKTDLRIEWRPMTSGTRKVTGVDFRFASDGKNNPLIIPGSDGDLLI